MGKSKVEEKKQACRDILERGMDGLATPRKLGELIGGFNWARFLDDLEKALEELETAAKAK